MNGTEYIETEYGIDHLKALIELKDYKSIIGLMEEYADRENALKDPQKTAREWRADPCNCKESTYGVRACGDCGKPFLPF